MQENKPNPETESSKTEPKFRVLGALGYNSPEDLEAFIESIDNQKALFILISAANFAQAKGVFSLTEASLIASAIKKFLKPETEEQSTKSRISKKKK